MCGRTTLNKTAKEIEDRFNAIFDADSFEQYEQSLPNYNVAPSHMMPIINNHDPNRIHLYRWGLIPFWAKDEKIGYKMINARVETLMEKSAFKNAIKHRRCLVPMDGFYEWKKEGKTKTPYRIILPETPIFTAAGLWETWKDHSGKEIFSFTVITQKPNTLMSSIHDRMPAILSPEQERLWIDNDLSPKDAISLIEPYPSDLMHAYMVSKRVGNVRNNDANLLDPIESPPPVQGELF